MPNLDDINWVREKDRGNILGSIRDLPEQVNQTWQEIAKIKIPADYKKTLNVVICGMGGSALGGRIVDCLFTNSLRGAIEIFTDYIVPDYIGPETLVILSSYSGNTEETLAAASFALKKNAKIFVLAGGGALAELAEKENLPAYIFDPVHNPSGQPRMGLGYSLTAMLWILETCGFIVLKKDVVQAAILEMRAAVKDFDVTNGEAENLAKKMAQRLVDKVPVLVSAEHLTGSTHTFKNQLNENSKTFAATFDLPEANHHLMEGLSFPKLLKTMLHFLIFDSSFFDPKIRKRIKITADVVKQNEIETEIFVLRSETQIGQVYELLLLSSYVSFYLALLNNLNPAPIPWVDYFKEKLAK